MLALCCLGALVMGVGSVCATWLYAEGRIDEKQQDLQSALNEFHWAPEEVLPDLESVGKSHLDLLDAIINHRQQGLNKAGSPLNNAIDNRIDLGKDTIGSMGVIQGGNLKHLFLTSETALLEFVIEFESDTEYNIYTFADDDLNTAGSANEEISVYCTKCYKTDGVWAAKYSEYGTALTMWYDADKGKKSLSINVKTWVESTKPLELEE